MGRRFALAMIIGGLGVTLVYAQSLPQSLPDQLFQCQALLRVKQDNPCRCDQAEYLAAALLRRAEKAEEDAAKLKMQLLDSKKIGEKVVEPSSPVGEQK